MGFCTVSPNNTTIKYGQQNIPCNFSTYFACQIVFLGARGMSSDHEQLHVLDEHASIRANREKKKLSKYVGILYCIS
jgi:hypothetical protein